MLKKITKIYKKYIYIKNITYGLGKLSFMHNFHYIKVTKCLRIIILLKLLNYPNPGLMYYDYMLKILLKVQVFIISPEDFLAFRDHTLSM